MTRVWGYAVNGQPANRAGVLMAETPAGPAYQVLCLSCGLEMEYRPAVGFTCLTNPSHPYRMFVDWPNSTVNGVGA